MSYSTVVRASKYVFSISHRPSLCHICERDIFIGVRYNLHIGGT